MRIALVQINPIIGDFPRNIATLSLWIDKAKEAGCDLVIFPEMAVCGYPPQDLLERPAFLADLEHNFQKLVQETKGIGVLCGTILRHTTKAGKTLHNSAVLFEDGEILFSAYKRLLPSYDVFDENRYFEPGQESQKFQYKGLNLGITICEDIWNDKGFLERPLYTEDPVAELMEGSKPDLLINLAASPFHLGKETLKHTMFSNLCTKYQIPLLYTNQVGGQDSLLFDGRSLAMATNGAIIGKAQGFTEDILYVDSDTLKADEWPNHAPIPEDTQASVLDALVMGVHDYVGKCGFEKVMIGLSGGIDSALTADIAARALGPKNVMGIALPSPYSSKESVEDAKELAANLDIEFDIIPIAEIFKTMKVTLAPLFGDMPEDITEQNIQARIRGNLLMALANKYNRLLLSTGNKSEMAVGYCTLYGDMSGGLAVISDVPKILVYELAHFSNQNGIRIPERTISKPPSAELAPDQKDEDDLPPYDILDPILAAYLEENKSIAEIVAMGFGQAVVTDIVRRIKINEYKRKQAPMGLKVTTKAFGHGRRYPICDNHREGAI